MKINVHYDNKTKTTKVETLIKRTTAEKKTFQLTENGEHTIIIEGYNSVGGHCSKRFDGQKYKIDKEIPSVPTLTGNPNRWVNYSFPLTGRTKEEYSGIDYWQYSYDKRNWTTYNNSSKNPFTTTDFSAERNQNVYIRTIDKAGNISQPASSKIQIDKTKPTISFTTPPGPHKNNGGIRAYGKCSDNRGGSGVANFTGNGTYIGSPTENKSVTLGCSDKAGNYNTATRNFSVMYKSRIAACGVERYKYKKSSACGAASCGSCQRYVQVSKNIKEYKETCAGTTCSQGTRVNCKIVPTHMPQFQLTCKVNSTQLQYYWCTSSQYCGWNGCRHQNHGVESYKSCWHY